MQAFERARRDCVNAMLDVGALSTTLPWLLSDVARTVEVMGPNYWTYGVQENLPTLNAMLRYSHEQRLSPRQVALEELFASGTYEGFKV